MNNKHKFLISIIAGLLAVTLRAGPMWWGVLFPSISHPLTCEAVSEESTEGIYWRSDNGIIFRFRSLDLLFAFFNTVSS